MPGRTPFGAAPGPARRRLLSSEPRSGLGGLTRVPGRAWLRFAVLIALLGAGFALVRWSPLGAYVDLDRAVATLEALGENPLAPAILVALWLVAAPLGIPVSPLVFASGAVFGTFWGWIYSLAGATLGSGLSFWISRRLGHELIAHWLGEERLSRVEKLVARHGFWTVFRLRFAPIPFVSINAGAALAGMRFMRFLAASTLGLAPSLWVYNYFSHALVDATAADRPGVWRNLFLALGAFLAITLLPQLVARLRRDPPSAGETRDD